MEDQDICEEYKSSLLELTFNSKPLISMLTMLAEDNVQHAPKIVQVIETYLLKAKPEVKLPIMYLIDSIIKNVGKPYLNLFIQNIVSNFCTVFEKVDEKTRSQLFKLRQTWNDIFPSKKLYAIDVRVSQIDPAWPVTAEKPTQTTIHINPKFLENKPKTLNEAELQQAQVHQQLLAKQQELMRLQQQKLQLEILQTQARLAQVKEQQLDPRLTQRDPRLIALNRDPRLVKTKPKNSVECVAKAGESELTSKGMPASVHNAADPPKSCSQPSVVDHATVKAAQKSPMIITLVPPSRVQIPPPPTSASSTSVPFSATVQPLDSGLHQKKEEKVSSEEPKLTEKKVTSSKKSNSKKEVKKDAKGSASGRDRNKAEDCSHNIDQKGKVVPNQDKSASESSKCGSDNDGSQGLNKVKGKEKNQPPSKTRNRRDRYNTRNRNRGSAAKSGTRNDQRHKKDKQVDSLRDRSRSPLKRNDKLMPKTADLPEKGQREGKESSRRTPSPKKSSSSQKTSDSSSHTDVDLRIFSSSADSGDAGVTVESRGKGENKAQKGKNLRNEESKENEDEPPYKKSKEDADIESLFGGQDQDYRHLPQKFLVVKRPEQKGWAQYKDTDKQRDNEDKDFRPRSRVERYGTSAGNVRSRGFRSSPPVGEGRNRRSNKMNFEARLFNRRGVINFGRSYDYRGGGLRKFDRYPEAQQVEFMVSHKEQIMRQAEQLLEAGSITKAQHCELMKEFEQLDATQKMQGRRTVMANLSPNHELDLSCLGDFRSRRQMDHIGSVMEICQDVPVSSNKDDSKDRPSAEESKEAGRVAHTILVDGQLRRIQFWGDTAIVLMDDDDPREMTFRGEAKKVFIDDMAEMEGDESFNFGEKSLSPETAGWSAPITLNFQGEEKEFVLNGKKHTIKFGCPLREVLIDGCPYQAQFGGPPIQLKIDGELHVLRLEGPAPKLSIGECSRKDLFEPLFLTSELCVHTSEGNATLKTRESVDSKTIVDTKVDEKRTDLRVEGADSKQPGVLVDTAPSSVDQSTKVTGEADLEKQLQAVSNVKDVDWRTVSRSEQERHPDKLKILQGQPHQFTSLQVNRLSPHGWERPALDDESRPHPILHPSMHRDLESSLRRRDDWSHTRLDVWDWDDRTNGQFDPGLDKPRWRTDYLDRSDHFLQERNTMSLYPDQRHHLHLGRGRSFQDGRGPWQEWHPGEFHDYNHMPPQSGRPMFSQRQGSPHHFDDQFLRDRPHSLEHDPRPGIFSRAPLPPPPPPPQICETGFISPGSAQQQMRSSHDASAYIAREPFFPSSNIPECQANLDAQPSRTIGSQFACFPDVSQPGTAISSGMPPQPQLSISIDVPNQGSIATNMQQISESLPNLDVSSLFAKLVAAGLIKNEQLAQKSASASGQADNAQVSEKKVSQEMPVIELKSECLKKHYSEVIMALYQGTQCASCGLRFLEDQQDMYSQHLDWHFRVNRREKDGAKKAFSRKWFFDIENWIQFEEIEDLEERVPSIFEVQASADPYRSASPTTTPSVPVSTEESENVCVVCGERFELFWVEEEEEWHLKEAVRVDKKSYHPLCYEDYRKSLENQEVETSSAGIPGLESLDAESYDITKVKEEVPSPEEERLAEEPESEPDECDKQDDDVLEEEIVRDVNSILDSLVEDVVRMDVKNEDEEGTDDAISDVVVKVEPMDDDINEMHINEMIPETSKEPSATLHSEEESVSEPRPEPKMVVIQSGGITLKVKAASIAMPASPSTLQEPSQAVKTEEESDSEEEFRPPTPDPRFQVFPPVRRGTELSGLCCIM